VHVPSKADECAVDGDRARRSFYLAQSYLVYKLKQSLKDRRKGAKGVYRTPQRGLAARFVQIEYEDKYRLMARLPDIDFIDTYSAGFRRDRFLEMSGYDTSFPVACAEDIELSYRMSARGWMMGVTAGLIYARRKPTGQATISNQTPASGS